MRRIALHHKTALLLLLMIVPLCQAAQAFQSTESPDKLWRIVDKNSLRISAQQFFSWQQNFPRKIEFVEFITLNEQKLRNTLSSAKPFSTTAANTVQQSPAGIVITLPLPDGTYARFLVQESSIMEPALERQFPDFKSYRGQGVDDPAMTVRFDVTPAGFQAIVLASDRTFYIDPFPLKQGDTETYITFFKHDYPANEKQIRCFVGEDPGGPSILSRRGSNPAPLSNGAKRRTYRLAVAATGEYTRFHGGTKEGAMNAILKTISRVNSIYENDLAISLKLVGDETKIIYTDPDRDPYTNSNIYKLINENQVNLDKEIGSANYDIGHVFGVGPGGLATLRSVGKSDSKAKGATGSLKPIGDPFDVDFVAHEMGHQFGANHTFNGTTGSCGSGNRNPTTAYEPGSGSTIMAYAGICGESDLQANSNSYFHSASLEEMIDYVASDEVKDVPQVTSTNNRPPTVVAGQHFIIPKDTPFLLRATGTDPDGDSITYSWEEFDLGDPSPPDDDVAGIRPLFRSFNPVKDAFRFFPRIENVTTNTSVFGESLPKRQRVIQFRVTARDNRSGNGGIAYTTALVSVIAESGPFVVAQPSAVTAWTAGSSQLVTWDVAGTSGAPISCGSVRISLSIDGGKTFTTLQALAPNTGTATILVPNTPTTKARVMVEGVDHAFFNVSKGDFTILSR